MSAKAGKRATIMRVAYVGTRFHGFARQENLRTVQGELETILSELYGVQIETRGASRTDSGVHARGQIVAFSNPPGAGLPAERLLLALRGLLPDDLEVSASWSLPEDADKALHPRHPNSGKHYCYRLSCAKIHDPLTAPLEWAVRGELDVELMREAASHFVGEHDFASFRASSCAAATTVRTIRSVRIDLGSSRAGIEGDPGQPHRGSGLRLEVHVHGDAFLMHMVRIMVGTLVDIGAGRLPPEITAQLLETTDRTKAGQTAPARGLCLEEVKWPDSLR